MERGKGGFLTREEIQIRFLDNFEKLLLTPKEARMKLESLGFDEAVSAEVNIFNKGSHELWALQKIANGDEPRFLGEAQMEVYAEIERLRDGQVEPEPPLQML